ncbi:MAG: hypothetical protein R6W83_08570 [Cryobacterium sp.]
MAYRYTGNLEQQAYLRRIIFGGESDERCLGPRWKWQLRRGFRPGLRDNVSLEFDQLPDLTARAPVARDGFVIPEWVWGELMFDDIDPKSHAMREHRRRIRKWGFTYEVKDDSASISQFMRDMVIPYTERHFGEEALRCAPDDRPWGDDRAEVLLVLREDVAVAGNLIVHGADGPVFWRVGVLGGNPEFVRQGALQAAYYFSHEHLKRHGTARVHAGATKPFLTDGVLAYKRIWGLRMTGPWRHLFLLRVRRTDEAARSFLVNNPFVMWDGGKLVAAVFLPCDTAPAEEELAPLTRFLWPGIDHVTAFSFEPHRKVSPFHGGRDVLTRRIVIAGRRGPTPCSLRPHACRQVTG